MIICPFCDAENIEGADACEKCGQSLAEFSLPRPATRVEQSLLKDRLDALSPKPPIAVPASIAVGDALSILVENGIGCLIVVADGKPAGIFSERDVLMKVDPANSDVRSQPLSSLMTTNPQTLDSSARVVFAVHQMDVGGYRHIPVTNADGKVTGVISVRDILNYLTERMSGPVGSSA